MNSPRYTAGNAGNLIVRYTTGLVEKRLCVLHMQVTIGTGGELHEAMVHLNIPEHTSKNLGKDFNSTHLIMGLTLSPLPFN